jgi:hypothetical protein
VLVGSKSGNYVSSTCLIFDHHIVYNKSCYLKLLDHWKGIKEKKRIESTLLAALCSSTGAILDAFERLAIDLCKLKVSLSIL